MNTTSFRKRRYPNIALWAAALVCLNGVACFRSLDLSQVKCNSKTTCPSPYSCSMDQGTYGHCVLGPASIDGGGTDLNVSPGSGGNGGKPVDGALGGGGTSGVLDARPIDAGSAADAPIETGGFDPAACTSAAACSTGYCVDSVCCESACDGQCESCKETGFVGKCKVIKGSPLSPRAVCGGTGTCGGQCDGTNSKTCTFPDSTTICTAATCTAGKVTTASVCNSVGACSTATGNTCPNSQCASDGSAKCATSCTASSCGAGFYCDTTGVCLAAQVSGSSCSSGATCASGYCVDGLCCDGKCDGQCESCKETGSAGKCTAVKGAPLATRTACGGTGTCKGQCDGTNGKACTSPDSSTVCTAATCTGGKATTASVCNGSGACTTATSSQCTSNLCATDGSGKCSGSCTAASCSAGTYCDSTGTCTKTLDNGTSCSAGTQCTSGNCVDGVCCDGACAGQCQSCKGAGSVGKCTAVKGAPISPRAACGGTGKCTAQCDGTNGTACAYPDSSTVCTPASCSTGKLTTQSVCNGSGNCTAATTNTCPSNLCGSDNASCSSSCTATSCGTVLYCGAGGACTPTLTNGQPCSGNAQCTNGNCVDGVCCDSACTGQCQSCSATPGTCKNVTTPRTACGGTGLCAGSCNGTSPACVFPGNTTTCSQAGCQNSTTALLPSTCDGAGNCPLAATNPCTYVCTANACGGVCRPGVNPNQCSTGGVPQQCGANGQWQNLTACPTSQVCSGAGTCGCPSNTSTCPAGTTCYSTNTDSSHCGASCQSCTGGKSCSSGTCTCPSSTTDCGTCVNVSSDKNNCGGCGNKCSATQTCSGGICVCNASTCGSSDVCGLWNFNSCQQDSNFWLDTSDSRMGASSLSVSAAKPRGGTCSLRFWFSADGTNTQNATLKIRLCSPASTAVVVHSFSFWIDFEGSPTFTNSGTYGSVTATNPSTGIGESWNFQQAVISTGTYMPVSGSFLTSPLATELDFFFVAPGIQSCDTSLGLACWQGWVYIDDVQIN